MQASVLLVLFVFLTPTFQVLSHQCCRSTVSSVGSSSSSRRGRVAPPPIQSPSFFLLLSLLPPWSTVSSLQPSVHMLAILNLPLNLSPELQSPVSNWWLNISVDNDNLKVRHHLQTPNNSFPAHLTSHLLCFRHFNCSAKILVIILGLSYTL